MIQLFSVMLCLQGALVALPTPTHIILKLKLKGAVHNKFAENGQVNK